MEESRCLAAARTYLIRRGYEVEEGSIGTIDDGVLVCHDGTTLVFVSVAHAPALESNESARSLRGELERLAVEWLASYGEADMAVRFDRLCICLVDECRALIRHNLNFLAS